MKWRYIEPRVASGDEQMATDFTLTMLAAGENPVLRFYGWEPPCISLGYNQSADEIDMDVCREAGVDVVRRPTGGRAVYHDREITYSVIIPRNNPLFTDSTSELYLNLSRGLVAGLKGLGIEAELEKRQIDLSSHYRKLDSVSCFSAAARYEVVVDGKKMVGSAQRRLERGVLQHGSILLGESQWRFPDFIKGMDAGKRSTLGRFLAKETVSISGVLGRNVAFLEAAKALKAGFESSKVINLISEPLTGKEKAAIDKATRRFVLLKEGRLQVQTSDVPG
jgi:lipoate-protein ligase A